ncbi:hypothetical protein EVAR_97976_1 [Eumeta japonica]|uniref:Uncharacterized protein n=1 Tax=Eumeta variegata TaxID=151549 RepID=A0A4C1XI34_EUMVA|nr:hypothetical protein EVAR_97976_1 [Eumeta japonica]
MFANIRGIRMSITNGLRMIDSEFLGVGVRTRPRPNRRYNYQFRCRDMFQITRSTRWARGLITLGAGPQPCAAHAPPANDLPNDVSTES